MASASTSTTWRTQERQSPSRRTLRHSFCRSPNSILFGLTYTRELGWLSCSLSAVCMSELYSVHVSHTNSIPSSGCVASMVRLKFLIDYGISTGEAADPTCKLAAKELLFHPADHSFMTDTTAPAIAWSGIEAGAAIVCACLPSTRNLYRRIASQLFPRLSLSLSSLNRFRVKQVTSITQNSRPRNESEIELSRTGGEA